MAERWPDKGSRDDPRTSRNARTKEWKIKTEKEKREMREKWMNAMMLTVNARSDLLETNEHGETVFKESLCVLEGGRLIRGCEARDPKPYTGGKKWTKTGVINFGGTRIPVINKRGEELWLLPTTDANGPGVLDASMPPPQDDRNFMFLGASDAPDGVNIGQLPLIRRPENSGLAIHTAKHFYESIRSEIKSLRQLQWLTIDYHRRSLIGDGGIFYKNHYKGGSAYNPKWEEREELRKIANRGNPNGNLDWKDALDWQPLKSQPPVEEKGGLALLDVEQLKKILPTVTETINPYKIPSEVARSLDVPHGIIRNSRGNITISPGAGIRISGGNEVSASPERPTENSATWTQETSTRAMVQMLNGLPILQLEKLNLGPLTAERKTKSGKKPEPKKKKQSGTRYTHHKPGPACSKDPATRQKPGSSFKRERSPTHATDPASLHSLGYFDIECPAKRYKPGPASATGRNQIPIPDTPRVSALHPSTESKSQRLQRLRMGENIKQILRANKEQEEDDVIFLKEINKDTKKKKAEEIVLDDAPSPYDSSTEDDLSEKEETEIESDFEMEPSFEAKPRSKKSPE